MADFEYEGGAKEKVDDLALPNKYKWRDKDGNDLAAYVSTNRTKADTAQASADNAQATADNATTLANDAQASADNAESTGQTAQATADNAQATADQAIIDADNAESTGQTALAAADNAQATADQAIIDAANAESTGQTALAAAAQAIADAAAAQAKADSSVQLTGNQEVNGSKTFVSPITVDENNDETAVLRSDSLDFDDEADGVYTKYKVDGFERLSNEGGKTSVNFEDDEDDFTLTIPAKSGKILVEDDLAKEVNVLKLGSDAYTHAQRGVVDGFEVERLNKLDALIEDNYRTPFIWEAGYSKGAGKIGVAVPDVSNADFSYTGGLINYTDKYGNPQVTVANEPAFDWSLGEPMLLLDDTTSDVVTGDISSMFDSSSFVWELCVRSFVEQNSVNRTASVNDATDNNTLRYMFTDALNEVKTELKVSNSTIFSDTFKSDITKKSNVQIKCNNEDFAIKVNGVLSFSQNTGTAPTENIFKYISADRGNPNSEKMVGAMSKYSIKPIESFDSTLTSWEQVVAETTKNGAFTLR